MVTRFHAGKGRVHSWSRGGSIDPGGFCSALAWMDALPFSGNTPAEFLLMLTNSGLHASISAQAKSPTKSLHLTPVGITLL